MPANPEYEKRLAEKRHFIDLLEVSAGHPQQSVKIIEGNMNIELASRLDIDGQTDTGLTSRQIESVSTLRSYVSFLVEKGILMPEQIGLVLEGPRPELDEQSPLDHVAALLKTGATRDQLLGDLSLREFHNAFLRPNPSN